MVMLRGGGLHTVNQYDVSVYFGSAIGLLHGRIPYRDFLFLHPPGITLALVPFAGLASLVGEANALIAGRFVWMGLGALNAVLVGRILRPLGLPPAVFGGLFYAVFYPAVGNEQSTRLETLATTCLLGALLLLAGAPRPRSVALAGVLLGAAATLKIWGVVPLVVVAGFLLISAGVRQAAIFAASAAATVAAICLPFVLAAPVEMWRYVVIDQLGRPDADQPAEVVLGDLTGLAGIDFERDSSRLLAVGFVAAAFLTAVLLAGTVAQARLAAILLITLSGMLAVLPIWHPHYAALIAGPAAVTVGAASCLVRGWSVAAPWRYLTAAMLTGWLILFATPLTSLETVETLPRAELRAAIAQLPGCITVDDTGTLIALDALGRNIDHGCPLSLDLDGYALELRPAGRGSVRSEQNELWQRHVLDYLSSGSQAIVTRYSPAFGITAATSAVIESWPVLARAGRFTVRQPPR